MILLYLASMSRQKGLFGIEYQYFRLILDQKFGFETKFGHIWPKNQNFLASTKKILRSDLAKRLIWDKMSNNFMNFSQKFGLRTKFGLYNLIFGSKVIFFLFSRFEWADCFIWDQMSIYLIKELCQHFQKTCTRVLEQRIKIVGTYSKIILQL